MANQAQKDAVVKLHGLSDSSDIPGTYGSGYGISYTDPYELAAVLASGGVYPAVVTGVTDGTLINGTVVGVIGTVDSVVTYESNAGTGALTYASSDPAVATVDASGIVSAVSDGTSTITATSVEDVSFSGTTSVTVAII